MNVKRLFAVGLTASVLVSSFAALAADAPQVGDNLTIGTYEQSAKETQTLIDARPDMQRPMENLGRGGVAVRMDDCTYISWRWLGTESADTRYNVYGLNGSSRTLLNSEPLNATNHTVLGGENWTQALLKTQNTGESADFEKYMFPEAVTARFIRYSGDGDTKPDKNYCHISEIAVLGEE